ncbi:MAG: dTMP kinase [Candidatus Parvarchaeota archaeon]|nr:dTMP kinase [Candidatus Parvarchaeota archaeon]MCW1301543.1 dTMP kinase [Candidatus Parvarchaeota archaeon]
MAGKLIVLEGLDGAGLNTQATLLEIYLKEKGYHTLLTSEPTNSVIGGIIRSSLNRDIKLSGRVLQLLFSADRANHLETTIQPAINANKIVICDRYIFSTLAYGYASGLNYKWLRQVNLSFRLPDLGILIDVKPTVSLSRISDLTTSFEMFNTAKQLSDVRKAFLMIANNFHIKVVDGNGNVETVKNKIINIVDKYLKKNKI